MAVRVRKLARQIRRSPAEVLGLLHALGFSKYKSAEDMVADAPASKARKAAQMGMKAQPVLPVGAPSAKSKAKRAAPAPADLMSKLVPGVVRQGAPSPAPSPTAKPPIAPTKKTPSPAEVVKRTALRDALDALAEAEKRCAALTAERDVLVQQLATAQETPPALGGTLGELLEARGLVGAAEQAVGLQALLGHHWARELVLGAHASDPEGLSVVLSERMLLVGDTFPELHGCVTVPVSSDRAELAGGDQIQAEIRSVGEGLMLNGYKRLCAVGVAPRWQKLLRANIDERVSIRFLPGGPRDAMRARNDCEDVDVVWTWEPVSVDEIRAIYLAATAAWVAVDGAGISAALAALHQHLTGGDG